MNEELFHENKRTEKDLLLNLIFSYKRVCMHVQTRLPKLVKLNMRSHSHLLNSHQNQNYRLPGANKRGETCLVRNHTGHTKKMFTPMLMSYQRYSQHQCSHYLIHTTRTCRTYILVLCHNIALSNQMRRHKWHLCPHSCIAHSHRVLTNRRPLCQVLVSWAPLLVLLLQWLHVVV